MLQKAQSKILAAFRAAPRDLQLLLQMALDGVLELRPPHVRPLAADLLAELHRAPTIEAAELLSGLGADLRHLQTFGGALNLGGGVVLGLAL